MNRYLAQRLLLTVPSVLGVTVLVFLLMRVFVPGDAVDVLLADYAGKDPALERQIRERYGLSASIPRQHVRWLADIMRGDLGKSFFTGRAVADELLNRLPVTVELGLLALAIAWGLGVPVGVLSAMKQDSAFDYLFRGLSILMLAVPNFWLALLVLTFGARWFSWVPPVRWVDPLTDPRAHLRLMLPAAAVLGATLSAAVVRFTRASMLEILRQDYIRTAHAKGLSRRLVVVRHALRNAMVPLVTLLGGEIAIVIGGAVIIKTIFNIPGVGHYYVDTFILRDYPVAQGVNLLLATVIVAANLVVDISDAYLDPRIRYG
jgi:peptide/nickel transport system permease protein